MERRPERTVPGADLRRAGRVVRTPGRERLRLLGWTFSGAVHLAALCALLWPRAVPLRPPAEPAPMMVSLAPSPKPEPLVPSDAMAPKIVSDLTAVQPVLPRMVVPNVVVAAAAPVPDDTSDLLSPSQLAGAVSASEQGGAGGCNTAWRVQQALRRDPLVRAAVADVHRLGKAIMLWDGDWVRTGEQAGKGLSAVREAVMWEVAFAPRACRDQHEHGLVLLSLADGGTRFAIGTGDWRWSDLLGVPETPADR